MNAETEAQKRSSNFLKVTQPVEAEPRTDQQFSHQSLDSNHWPILPPTPGAKSDTVVIMSFLNTSWGDVSVHPHLLNTYCTLTV